MAAEHTPNTDDVNRNKMILADRRLRMTGEQCRAARGLLGLSQKDLAAKAAVFPRTVQDFEAGARQPLSQTLAVLQNVLEDAGVEFIPENGGGEGVRFRDRREARKSAPDIASDASPPTKV
jgi:transcriptional regulator with XRE-family HTH domain